MRATKCRVSALLATMTLTIALSGAALGQTPAQQQPTPEVLEYKGLGAAAREVEAAPRLHGLLRPDELRGRRACEGGRPYVRVRFEEQRTLTRTRAGNPETG